MSHGPRLDKLFEMTNDGYCLCEMIRDADGRAVDYRFLETNGHFERMTGLSNVRHRTARELVPGLEQVWVDTYDRVARGEPMRFQNRSEAMARDFDVCAMPADPEGCFVLVFRDVTERARADHERDEALRRANDLLAELNHRVMNTLAIITSIVRMELRELQPSEGQRALEAVEQRLGAVTALYRVLNRAAAVSEVAADQYLPQVARAVAGSVSDTGRVTLSCDIAAEALPTAQAAPLGLLLNEVMTNAVKHAFPDDRSGRLHVTLRRLDPQRLELAITDDGIGTADAQSRQVDRPRGLGTRLIEAFAEQIDGTLQRDSSDAGTRLAIVFPLAEQSG